MTGRGKYQNVFQPLLPGCVSVPFGELYVLEKELKKEKAAAFIVEPVQGEGGIIVPPPGYLSGVRELCSKYETMLIVDEIQTGFGRTGKMFACQHDDVVPDIMCLAKSLGGGIMPAGVYITTDEIWKKAYGNMEKALLHTTTFGGDTWAAAAGIAALEIILDEKLADKARESGEYLMLALTS